jgi:HEAT repeat protein
VDALGLVGDPAAIEALSAVVRSPAVEPVTAQHALLSLGRIGDAKAAPVVLRSLFEARAGVSFFPQAAMAAVQLGKPMVAPLLVVLEGKDAELEAWAKDAGVVQGALYAKAAQLLGEIGGPDAVPGLISRLSYRDADESLQMLVRVIAAEALGRLRARTAVQPIADLLAREADPVARLRYCEALARIGDPAALPALRAAAAKGDWDDRAGALEALSRLGAGTDAELVQQAAAAAACTDDCPRARDAAVVAMKARLAAAGACTDVRCWAGKLADPSAAIRDRAALEVGRAGAAADAPALARALLLPVDDETGLAARYHAVLGLSWLVQRESLGAAGPEIAAQIDALVASPAEKGRRLTQTVNEDALRLAMRLRKQ